MTESEAIEFFNKVKDKRIKWSSWNGDVFFIPRIRFSFDIMRGTLNSYGIIKEEALEGINHGFYNDYNKIGWVFLDSIKEEKVIDNKCTCDFRDVILITGCKCGGK